MHTFETLFMANFRKKWRSQEPLSLNATNPQPFTLKGLNTLIGRDLLSLEPTLLLDYGMDAGLPDFRSSLCREFYPGLGAQHLVTTAGGKEAIYICMHALLEKGDQVISFTPTFEPLIKIAKNIGCDVKLLPLDENKGWELDLDAFKSCVNDETKMVIINFPHNPTGTLITQDELNQVIELCRQHDVWLFSDEVFRGLEHRKEDRLSPVAQIYKKGISIGVLSKSHGVPSIRVGWVASQNLLFLERLLEVKSYLSVCNGKLSEIIATPIIEHSNTIFENHRRLLVKNITILEELKTTYPHFNFHSPKAGCTVFASVEEPCEAFAEELVRRHNLLVIPAGGFVTKANAFRLGFSYLDFETRFKGFIEMLNEGTK